MNPKARDRFLKNADSLLVDGRGLLRSEVKPGGGQVSPDVFVVPGPPYLNDSQACARWLASCRNLVVQIGKPATAWERLFQGSPTSTYGAYPSASFRIDLGQLESLRHALAGDALTPVEDLIVADAFGSLLEQAEELRDKNYDRAAGTLGRAVLEEHLRKLCERHNCLPTGRPTINDLNQSLYKGQHLDKLAMQSVTAMATIGNDCAHVKPITPADVAKFLRDVGEFLERNPLP